MNEPLSSNHQLPEFTYEQIVEGKRPPVLSGPYIPAYLVKAEIERLRAALGRAKDQIKHSDNRCVCHEVYLILEDAQTLRGADETAGSQK